MPETAAPITLWLLTDGKPGHRNQLQGLLSVLEELAPVDAHWLDCNERCISWIDVLMRRFPAVGDMPPPTMAVAAGHGTHRALLGVKRRYGAFSAVLMKPSLPINCFDAAIVPRHDMAVANDERVLVTDGVLNTVRPTQPISNDQGLVVLGGQSKHYTFDAEAITAQVLALLDRFPDHHWQISDSRRTPPACLQALSARPLPRVSITPWQQTPSGWLARRMASSGMIWVTPDSVSMVYEALTVGAPVGLFDLPVSGRAGRVVKGVERLHQQQWVNALQPVLSGRHMHLPPKPLWEARRAGQWLLERYQAVSGEGE